MHERWAPPLRTWRSHARHDTPHAQWIFFAIGLCYGSNTYFHAAKVYIESYHIVPKVGMTTCGCLGWERAVPETPGGEEQRRELAGHRANHSTAQHRAGMHACSWGAQRAIAAEAWSARAASLGRTALGTLPNAVQAAAHACTPGCQHAANMATRPFCSLQGHCRMVVQAMAWCFFMAWTLFPVLFILGPEVGAESGRGACMQ